MSFEVDVSAYARFMGRYADPLASQFVEKLSLSDGQRALDVGCGTGALTAELVQRLGQVQVSAIDPSERFVAAMQRRFADVDVRSATAEDLPYDDDLFDVAAAQLVVHFMTDPVEGLSEMARVTRPGGLVAACVWDHAGGGGPLSLFWEAVGDLDPGAHDESGLAGAREGHLAELFELAGLTQIDDTTLSVCVGSASFAEWWEPYTLGVGPAGEYVAKLDDDHRRALEERCRALLPAAPFEITATAWTAIGEVED